MYSKDEAKQLMTDFWNGFANYTLCQSARLQQPVEWMLYKTGIKGLELKFDLDCKWIRSVIEVNARSESRRQAIYDELLKAKLVKIHQDDKVLAFARANYLFVFNFHPTKSFEDYPVPADDGEYQLLLDSDAQRFNGFNRLLPDQHFFARPTDQGEKAISLYLPTRTALVIKALNH